MDNSEIQKIKCDVKGKTDAEIRKQMNFQGVLWTTGQTQDAFTIWNVNMTPAQNWV